MNALLTRATGHSTLLESAPLPMVASTLKAVRGGWEAGAGRSRERWLSAVRTLWLRLKPEGRLSMRGGVSGRPNAVCGTIGALGNGGRQLGRPCAALLPSSPLQPAIGIG